MAVRIPEVKKEDETMTAVDDEEAKKSREKENTGKVAKAGEKRNSSSLGGSDIESKRCSLKNDSEKEKSTRREEHDAKRSGIVHIHVIFWEDLRCEIS